MKRVIVGGLYGFLSIVTTSWAVAEPQQQQEKSMTVLKEWSPEIDVNGNFEADRRAWLASLRAQRVTIDPDKIVAEKLAPIDSDAVPVEEFSCDTLYSYIDTISAEIDQSQKKAPEN
jgi:hypothetical protein